MENVKAILNIRQNKKGKNIFDFIVEEGKQLSISWFPPDKKDKKWKLLAQSSPIAVTLRVENGTAIAVEIDGQLYKKTEGADSKQPLDRNLRNRRSDKSNVGSSSTAEHAASAPYNFIPLNDQVVVFQKPPQQDCYDEHRLSGYLALSGTTLTPLFIGDDKKAKETTVMMTALNGAPYLPGSSLRGMVRQLIEIAGYAKFTNFDDKRLYFRAMADMTDLKQEYKKVMGGENGENPSQAGYLRYSSADEAFYIIPAQIRDGKSFYLMEPYNKEWEFTYKKKDGIYAIFTGAMTKKKKHACVYPPNRDVAPILVSSEDIADYREDRGRTIPVDILESAKAKCLIKNGQEDRGVQFDEGVPIFYQNKTGHVIFGHTPYFRVPYDQTVKDHVPSLLQDTEVIDLAETLFGKEGQWATRLFFDDWTLSDKETNWRLCEEVQPKVLNQPKPTTFQHYLEQNGMKQKERNNWNSGKTRDGETVKIRGYKLYWHRNTPYDASKEQSWVEVTDNATKQNNVHMTMQNVVKPTVVFVGRIRFENLTEVELGALLFVLQLPQDGCYAHKLGMGKPLGLGSIQLSLKKVVRLHKKAYYEKLFADDQWNLAETDILFRANDFTKKFERYVLDQLYGKNVDSQVLETKSLWDEDRLKKLQKMLDWSVTKNLSWNEATRYLKSGTPDKNEYRTRPILPSVDNVTS